MFGHMFVILFLIFKTAITGITKTVKNWFFSFLFFLFFTGREVEVSELCITFSWKIRMFNRRVVGLLMQRKSARRLSPVPRCRSLEIPGRLAVDLRLRIEAGLDVEVGLRSGKNLGVEAGRRLGLLGGLRLGGRR